MARLIGINHVALEVEDVDTALDWYGRFFEFELRGRIGTTMAFVDMGDQFIALSAGRRQPPDQARHFGLVVDDKEGVRAALREAGVGPGWARIRILVQYDNRLGAVAELRPCLLAQVEPKAERTLVPIDRPIQVANGQVNWTETKVCRQHGRRGDVGGRAARAHSPMVGGPIRRLERETPLSR